MNRKTALTLVSLLLIGLMASACSLNRQLPAEFDEEAMEADVRAAIATAVPGKTFAVSVDVTANRNVRLEGHVDSASDRTAIIDAVRRVNGVNSVDASGLHVQP